METPDPVFKKLRSSYAEEAMKLVPDEKRLDTLRSAINTYNLEPGMLTAMK